MKFPHTYKVLFSVAVIVPAMLFAAVAGWSWVRLHRAAAAEAARTADTLHEHASRLFQAHALVFDRITERIGGQAWQELDRNRVELHRYLLGIVGQVQEVRAIRVYDMPGTLRMVSQPAAKEVDTAPEHVEAEERSAVERARQTNEVIIGNPYRDRVSGEVVFTVARRLVGEDGRLLGVASLALARDYFTGFWRGIGVAGDSITIARPDGVILARWPAPHGDPIQVSQVALEDRVRGAVTGTYEAASSIDGKVRIFAFRRLDTLPLYVVYGHARSAIVAEWVPGAMGLGFLCIMAAIAMMLAARWALRNARSEADVARLEELTNTLDLAPVAVRNRAGRILFWSLGLERLYGYSREEVAGRPGVDVLATVFPCPREEVEEALERDGRWQGDLTRRRADGTTITVGALWARHGEVIIEVSADVTERRLAEEALRASEERFRALLKHLPQNVWIANTGGEIIYFNERWLEYTGIAPSSAEDWIETIHPEDRAHHLAVRASAIAADEPFEVESRLRRADGEWRWQLTRLVPMRQDGVTFAWLGHSTDIHDIRLAQEAIKESEARYRAIVDTALDAIVVIDERRAIQSFNAAAETMFGYAAEEAIGGDIAMLLPGVDVVAGERRREVDGRRKDGTTFPLDVAIAEWRTAQGRFFTGMLRDATERKRSEEALRRSHEELEARVAERTAQLEAVNRRLISEMAERGKAEEQLRQAQKMEAVGRLTGGIAHDFNNLLTVIGGNLDLLERRVGDPGLRRMAASAGQAASRAEKLTAQLLAFSRRAPLRPQALDVNDIVYGMDDLLRRTAGEQVELRLSLSGSVRPALADQNQLETALLNLVINARAATPSGGTIVVETRNIELPQGRDGAEPVAPGHYVQVSVIDTGHGMSADVAARAFEPFFTTKPTGEGTGLGLSQVYGFVRQSGGHVEIESEEGRGTAVRLLLPSGAAGLLVRQGESLATALPRGREKVLLVEDEEEVRRFAAELLRELGYTVVEAADGAAGLRLLATNSDIDLLFSDVVMPGVLSGLDLAHEARRLRPDLAILLASGYSAQIRVDEIARAGFGYLPKPFRVDTLARGVRAALDDTGSEAVAIGD